MRIKSSRLNPEGWTLSRKQVGPAAAPFTTTAWTGRAEYHRKRREEVLERNGFSVDFPLLVFNRYQSFRLSISSNLFR
jgi:hypothetical protein